MYILNYAVYSLGPCPLFQDCDYQVNYLLLSNGSMLLRCANNEEQVFAECGIKGEWSKTGISCLDTSETVLIAGKCDQNYKKSA